MKNRVAQILSLGIALVTMGTVQAQGQSVTADVPFMYYVGSTLMPQGPCQVIPENFAVTWIRSTEKDITQAVMTFDVVGTNRTEPAKLVFHRYGEDYFLSEIWTDGATGRALARSSREKELARSGSAPTLAVIQVALHR